MLKNLVAKLIGKYVGGNIGASKTKLTAVIYVILQAVPVLTEAFGTRVEIPQVVFRILEAAGLWSLRDSIKS